MGGPGSGRWGGHRRRIAVEQCHVLSVQDLLLEGNLEKEAVLTLTFRGTSHELRAVSSPCRFGGVRWWLVCDCGRRVLKVYCPPGGRRFACRTCHGLTYTSSQEAHKFDGLFRKLAVGMGPGWTVKEVKATLDELAHPPVVKSLVVPSRTIKHPSHVIRGMRILKNQKGEK